MPRYTTHQPAAFTAIERLFGRPLAAVSTSELVPNRDLAALSSALKSAAPTDRLSSDQHRRALYQAWLLSPLNPDSPAAESFKTTRGLINRLRPRDRTAS